MFDHIRVKTSLRMRCAICVLMSSILMSLWLTLGLAEDLPTGGAGSQTAPATGGNTKTKVVYREKSYYDFEDSLINGNLRKPDGSFVFRKNQSTFSSALNLKRSFIPELRESSKSAR